MKIIPCIASAVLAAASIAACDSSSPAKPAAANMPASTAAAPATDFKSVVTPNPAPDATQAADTELSKKVRSALTTTNAVEIGGVEVAAADGVVTLYGTVQMPAEKDRAAMLALGIDGVRSVVNNLVVIRGS